MSIQILNSWIFDPYPDSLTVKFELPHSIARLRVDGQLCLPAARNLAGDVVPRTPILKLLSCYETIIIFYQKKLHGRGILGMQ
jgi:hypothetical protein